MKKVILFILAAVLSVSFFSFSQDAEGRKASSGPLEDKFNAKVNKILTQKEQLKLTEEQVKRIEALKLEVNKNLTKQDADIETLTVEINTFMWEAPLDLEKTNALVAEKHELVKKKDQYLLFSMDKLNKILTSKQHTRLK